MPCFELFPRYRCISKAEISNRHLPHQSYASVVKMMSGKQRRASGTEDDLNVMDTVEQYETYEDYLDSQVPYYTDIY